MPSTHANAMRARHQPQAPCPHCQDSGFILGMTGDFAYRCGCQWQFSGPSPDNRALTDAMRTVDRATREAITAGPVSTANADRPTHARIKDDKMHRDARIVAIDFGKDGPTMADDQGRVWRVEKEVTFGEAMSDAVTDAVTDMKGTFGEGKVRRK